MIATNTVGCIVVGVACCTQLYFEIGPDDHAIAYRNEFRKLHGEFSHAEGWDIILPEGKYSLCIATRRVTIQTSTFAPRPLRVSLPSGHHRIVTKTFRVDGGWAVTVSDFDTLLLSVREPTDWNHGRGSAGVIPRWPVMGKKFDEPMVLLQEMFGIEESPNEIAVDRRIPGNGVQVWIENR